MFDFEAALAPYLYDPETHDTSLTRVVLGKDACLRYGFKPRTHPVYGQEDSTQAWCLTIGKPCGVKIFNYGLTIEQAFQRFQEEYQKLSVFDRIHFGLKISLAKKTSPKKPKSV